MVVVGWGGLTGCRDQAELDGEEIIGAVRTYVVALSGGDIDAALGTVSAGSPAREALESSVARLSEIGARLVLKKAEVLESTTDEAQVAVNLEVRGTPPFRGYRLSGVYVLERGAEGWRVISTEIGRLEYLTESE